MGFNTSMTENDEKLADEQFDKILQKIRGAHQERRTEMKPNREYREWYLKDNFYQRNVIHPVGDIFGTQIDVHAIEMRAYLEALAQAEKLEAALRHIDGDFHGYCAICCEFGKTGEEILKHYSKLSANALLEFEKWKGEK